MNSMSPTSVQYLSQEELHYTDGRQFFNPRASSQGGSYPGLSPRNATCSQYSEPDEVDKIKSKLLSTWNNMKYGWSLKIKTNFSKVSPVHLFGRVYHFGEEDWTWSDVLISTNLTDMQPMKAASLPCPNISHLHHASSIPTNRTVGPWELWAHRHICRSDVLEKECYHRKIISWFADQPQAPFGIHQLVDLGHNSGKRAGDWYGPSVTAHILRKAVDCSIEAGNLVIYVSQDCTVYKGDVANLAKKSNSRTPWDPEAEWKAVIILVPMRLGGETFNPAYVECIKELLKLDFCIGIIGGKPKHSLYFVGYQDDFLLYLDPHYCQPFVDTTKENFPVETFHCNYPRKTSFTKLDPSCTIGFYVHHRMEFEHLCLDLTRILNYAAAKEKYPMFSVVEGCAQEYGLEEMCTQQPIQVQQHSKRDRIKKTSAEEFVVL